MNVFGGFYGSMIKRLLTDNPPFYPLYGNFFINRKLPILVDVNNLMTVYLSSPSLRLIIDKKATMFKGMNITLVKIGDEAKTPITKHKVLDLLNKPDPLRTWQDWLMAYSIYKDIYNQTFTYKLKGLSYGMPACLWLLPPGEMKITPTGKMFGQTKMENIIDKYTQMFALEGQSMEPVDYTPDQIIHITEGVSLKYIVGESKLLTMRMAISNIDGALKSRNILIHERGAFGVISPEASTNDAMPLGEEERKRIEEDYRKKAYGLNDDQMKWMFSQIPVKFSPMAFPTKDLLLFEEVEDDFCALCGAFGMAREIFPVADKSSQQNQASQITALKRTYQDTIIPEAEQLMAAFNQDPDLSLKAQGLELIVDYNHLPSMQADKTEEATAFNLQVESASLLLHDGVIDHDTYADIVGVPMTGTKVITPKSPILTESNSSKKPTEDA